VQRPPKKKLTLPPPPPKKAIQLLFSDIGVIWHSLVKQFFLISCIRSQTGKRLMAKCRMLLQENEELGKMISAGRTAKLEGEIALEKKFVEEMKKSQAGKFGQLEMGDFSVTER
jgi:hypothetical protein